MPLTLNADTARPKELSWDPLNSEETAEMDTMITSLLDDGYRGWVDREKGEALLTPPPLDLSKFVFRVLSENGDDRLVWDRRSLDQVWEARKTFNDYLAKGYKAYIVRCEGGAPGAEVTSFDEVYEEVIVKKDGEALLVPPVVPG